MSRLVRLVAFSVAVASIPSSARAGEPTGPEILAKVDQGLNAFKDAIFESKLVLRNDRGEAREYAFTTWQKVPDKRLVRFSSPGDVRGMGFLVEGKDTLYVYLPGFQKIRRMGTHVKNQTFMGSDFSYEDMSQLAFGSTYDASVAAQDDKAVTLELKGKPGLDLEFPRARLTVDKANFTVLKIEFQDAGGRKLKTQLREGYKQDSPTHFQPSRIVVTDHRRGDHTSEIVFSSSKIDTGLSDDLFSQRSLIRGN